MTITVEIPDDIAASVIGTSASPGQVVLEAVAADAHRRGCLTSMQVRQWLGHDSAWETRQFLAEHKALPELTMEEILQDANTAAPFIIRKE